jgi:trk system potassium uptake protein TrkH
MVVVGVFYLLPLLLLLFYPAEARYAGGFAAAGLPLALLGALLWLGLRPAEPASLTMQEGMVLVVALWLVSIAVGALPFMLNSEMSFTHAAFETTSGWTTTGLSVFDLEAPPRMMLLYRSLLQLMGGAGFAIVTLSAITGPAGSGLVAAEGRTDQLAPHVRRSAEIVLRLYLSYVGLGMIALKLAGMGWFDAVNHAITAVATGGFSTQAASIGHWQNPAVEVVIMVLMLLGSLNFLTAYTLLRRKLQPVARNGEVRLVLVVLPVTIALIGLSLAGTFQLEPLRALRTAAFESVSALSGTGFNIVTYRDLSHFALLILIGLMTIGGGSGSTAGGIKQARVYLLYKGIVWEFRRAFLPQHTINEPALWQGDQRLFLDDRRLRQVALFIAVYMSALFLGSAWVAAHGYDLEEALFEFASALGTVGLSIGLTTPAAPDSLLWGLGVGMFLGRLEFFAVFIGLYKLASDLPDLLRLRRQGR